MKNNTPTKAEEKKKLISHYDIPEGDHHFGEAAGFNGNPDTAQCKQNELVCPECFIARCKHCKCLHCTPKEECKCSRTVCKCEEDTELLKAVDKINYGHLADSTDDSSIPPKEQSQGWVPNEISKIPVVAECLRNLLTRLEKEVKEKAEECDETEKGSIPVIHVECVLALLEKEKKGI